MSFSFSLATDKVHVEAGICSFFLNVPGYLNDEATMSIDKEGWLHTGDVVYFDQDGYLYMFSRIKEIIKYKGFQVNNLFSMPCTHPDGAIVCFKRIHLLFYKILKYEVVVLHLQFNMIPMKFLHHSSGFLLKFLFFH